MRILQQFLIILTISMVAEILYKLANLPIPTSIYGFVLMFFLLYFKIIHIPDVKEVSNFLLTAMQIMFIPAGVGVMNSFAAVKGQLLAVFLLIFLTTIIVTVVTGKVSDYLLTTDKEKNDS